jgi:uncharacterized OB-fold protein
MSHPPTTSRPLPEIDRALAPFFAAAKKHRLVVQRCGGCGTLRFPPRELCSSCLSTEVTWVEVSGRGEIFSYNVMHQVYHPAFATEVPYAVVVVKLAEGPKMISNLVDCPVDEIQIGLPVEVVFEPASAEITLPKFRRAGGAHGGEIN